MNLLEKLELICFEIGHDCNLKELHDNCPINHRSSGQVHHQLTEDKIIAEMDGLCDEGYKGYYGFHFYNEPLLYEDVIRSIIQKRPSYRYFLWTNGLLINDRNIDVVGKFHKIMITCYDKQYKSKFEKIKASYPQITIIEWELDDRTSIYSNDNMNVFGCRKPLVELPIDFWGNVHLCCNDWNNTFRIGNINETSLVTLIKNSALTEAIHSIVRTKLDINKCPAVCHKCETPWVVFKKDMSEKGS